MWAAIIATGGNSEEKYHENYINVCFPLTTSSSLAFGQKLRWIYKLQLVITTPLIFLPYIYCSEVGGNTCVRSLNCLLLIQKKHVRFICRTKKLDHISFLYSELRVLKLPDNVDLRIAILMHKANSNLLPMNIHSLITLYTAINASRQSLTLKQHKTAHKA